MSTWFERDFFDVLRKERGASFGAQLHLFEEIGSTNDEALRAVATRAPSGSVWLARSQKSGRGRRGNTWHAAPGESLLVSCLLRYRGPTERLLGLSLVVGLAVRDVVLSKLPVPSSGEGAKIKWPNDVFVRGKKVAGVLVETRSEPSGEIGVVMGVGLNITTERFPPELPAATSLRLEGAEEAAIRLEIMLVEFLGVLEKKLALFVESGLLPYVQELRAADYLKGKALRVGKVEGIGAGFDDDGRLLVKSEAGTVPVVSGTVELVDGP
jgi:BirA family biotin operon repressor/biotin-[acetyl-CoA-carboxylase] ligase